MKGSVNKPTFRIALCAAVAALEIILMMIAGLTRLGTYAFPCFAGFLTIAVVIEYKCKWAFAVYAVAALLSFFLAADKEPALMFTALFGYYPILKNILERRVKNRAVCWIVKFAVFNAAAVASFFIATLLLSIPASEFTLFGVYVPLVFLGLGNAFFILYDLSVNAYVRFYVQRLRGALFGRFL